jgi:acetyl-CoA carboxylase biotin carboxyl carrier protein
MTMADITAHITGKVFTIEKQVGDQVREGDAVIILESMKMEIPLESPIDGTITEIRVAQDDAVSEGVVVAVVE